eukprot:366067-Chlamydomonas_euryale.AAC.4
MNPIHTDHVDLPQWACHSGPASVHASFPSPSLPFPVLQHVNQPPIKRCGFPKNGVPVKGSLSEGSLSTGPMSALHCGMRSTGVPTGGSLHKRTSFRAPPPPCLASLRPAPLPKPPLVAA